MKNCRLLLSSNLEIRRAELRDRRGTPFSAGAMLTRLWKHLPAVLVAAADLAVQQFDADSPSGRVFHLQPLETGKSWQSCHSMLVLAFRVFSRTTRSALSHRKGEVSTGCLACVYSAGLLFSGSRKREQGAVCRRLQT